MSNFKNSKIYLFFSNSENVKFIFRALITLVTFIIGGALIYDGLNLDINNVHFKYVIWLFTISISYPLSYMPINLLSNVKYDFWDYKAIILSFLLLNIFQLITKPDLFQEFGNFLSIIFLVISSIELVIMKDNDT